MNLIYIILPLLVVGTASGITLLDEVAEAQSPPESIGYVNVKVVINFEHSANLSQVMNVYQNSVKPQAVVIINSYSSKIDNFSMESKSDVDSLYKIGFNDVTGKNIYELYPQVTFFGNLPDGVTKAQFDNQFNNFLGEMKTMLKSEFQSNNADVTFTHVHYTTGSVDE